MNTQSAVDFSGSRRIHIGLAVTDLDRSKYFYQTLLDVEPSKVRSGYAKFEPDDPSVNLSLNQIDKIEKNRNGVSHFGIQVKSATEVKEAIRRFREAGLETQIEKDTTCCYAVQDKVWAIDPDGNRWEIFLVKEKDAPERNCNVELACSALC